MEARSPHHWQVREVPLTHLEQKFSSIGEHKDFPGTCTTHRLLAPTLDLLFPEIPRICVFTRNLNKEPRRLVSSRGGLRKDEWHTLRGTSKMPVGEFDSSVFSLVFLGMQKLFFFALWLFPRKILAQPWESKCKHLTLSLESHLPSAEALSLQTTPSATLLLNKSLVV